MCATNSMFSSLCFKCFAPEKHKTLQPIRHNTVTKSLRGRQTLCARLLTVKLSDTGLQLSRHSAQRRSPNGVVIQQLVSDSWCVCCPAAPGQIKTDSNLRRRRGAADGHDSGVSASHRTVNWLAEAAARPHQTKAAGSSGEERPKLSNGAGGEDSVRLYCHKSGGLCSPPVVSSPPPRRHSGISVVPPRLASHRPRLDLPRRPAVCERGSSTPVCPSAAISTAAWAGHAAQDKHKRGAGRGAPLLTPPRRLVWRREPGTGRQRSSQNEPPGPTYERRLRMSSLGNLLNRKNGQ